MRDLFDEPTRRVPFPDQLQAIEMLRDAIRLGYTRICLQAPVAFGKTLVSGLISSMAMERDHRVAFCVPLLELIDQTVASFREEGIESIGVIQADHPLRDPRARMQVCSVQTLSRRGYPDVKIALIDEAHISSALVRRWMREKPETIFIGLSATPWREGMAAEYQTLVRPIAMAELIRRGRLSPYRMFALSHPDLGNIKTVKGDYDPDGTAQVMSGGALLADIVQSWLLHAEARPTVCFCVDRAHAKRVQAQFQSHGVAAAYLDAYTDKIERRYIREAFHRGEIQVVCNVGVLTTGADWDVRCISMCRPTKSEMLWVQMLGRGLRLAHGKTDCLILDHTDNILRLGFPDDIDAANTQLLAGTAKVRSVPAAALPKACSKCGYIKAPRQVECPVCGFRPERKSNITPLDGELVEVGRTADGKRQMSSAEKAMWHRQLYWIAVDRHGRTGRPIDPLKWTLAKYKARVGAWPKNSRTPPLAERPCREVSNWVKAQDIAYARAKEKERANA